MATTVRPGRHLGSWMTRRSMFSRGLESPVLHETHLPGDDLSRQPISEKVSQKSRSDPKILGVSFAKWTGRSALDDPHHRVGSLNGIDSLPTIRRIPPRIVSSDVLQVRVPVHRVDSGHRKLDFQRPAPTGSAFKRLKSMLAASQLHAPDQRSSATFIVPMDSEHRVGFATHVCLGKNAVTKSDEQR